ncbi:hypothetical protein GF374_02550 [Candidatus Woesearchaeota archaeon]|nr:hypothetical protein [Candidatus Woesearchaeota archaeon]
MVKLKSKKRIVSKKVWIKDLHSGEYTKTEGWNPNYIEINSEKISRVHLIATTVSKFISEDGNYGTITLDDGSETIRIKAFGPDVIKLKDSKIGKLVRFIGKVKEYNDEIYLSPEVIRNIEDPNWMIVHKLELGQPSTGTTDADDVKPSVPEDVAEETIKEEDLSVQNKIVNVIKEVDIGEGAELDIVIKKSGLDVSEAKSIIIGLLKSGDIYEPKKGRLKVLE